MVKGFLKSLLKRQASEPQPSSQFEPQNALEVLLIEASGDPGQRNAFTKAMLEGELFVATPKPSGEEERSAFLEAGDKVSLLNVTRPDGASAAAVFTSQARIVECFGPEVGYLRASGAALLEMVAASGVVLNPSSAYGVHWEADQVAAMLGKPTQRVLEEDTQVMLGSPAEPPTALLAALRERLGSDGRIAEAWFALAHWPASDQWSWYLDIRTTIAPEEIHALLADIFSDQALAEGRPLDMVINAPGDEEGAGIRLVPGETH